MFIVPVSQLNPAMTIEELKNKAEVQADAGNNETSFENLLSQAMDNVRETQEVAAKDSYDLAMGNSDDLHTIMINSAKATAAVEMATQLTSRVISAYKEISQMQI